MYLDWFGMHFPKSKMVSYKSVMGTGHTVQLLCDTEVSKAFITEYIDRGRVEIGGVYLPSQQERTPQLCMLWTMVDTVKGGGRAPLALTRLG